MPGMWLTREVRFSLGPEAPAGPVLNSWAGWPASDALAPFVTLRVTVAGDVDPRTGYLCNIALIDRVVRARVIPWLRAQRGAEGLPPAPALLLPQMVDQVRGGLPPGVRLAAVDLRLSPHLSLRQQEEESRMVAMTQAFEFAAAHRLFCAELSPEENQRTFGKCTNPNGHGHNYIVEVTVRGTPDPGTGVLIEVGRLEQTVKEHVIDVFDHKHLNADCAEFARLNPSVENITQVIWQKLEGRFAPAELAAVRVYETPKTWAELRR